MADQAVVGITPQELLVRSNPAMYAAHESVISGPPRDLTNPREMYNILSYKTKSTEDLATRFKQELAKSLQTPGIFPKLSRTTSMNEIRRSHIKVDRLSNKPFQSTSNLLHADKKVNVVVLARHRTSVDDFRKIPEEDKENSLNLPNINRNISQEGTGLDGKKDNYEKQVELPNLTEERQNTAGTGTGTKTNKDIQKRRLLRVKEELSASDSKLDKWFSEMPNEVFDKAQRALMEESIKDRLQKYQSKRSKKVHLPHQSVNVYVGSKMRKVPNTYLELHVDSFGKHLQNDTGDKMIKYKMHQKSMLKLKMRDLDEIEKMDRGYDDTIHKPSLQHRSLTTLALTKTKVAPPLKQNTMLLHIPTDRGMKTVNMNDRVDLESEQRSRQHMSFYEEYTERLNMMKTSADLLQTQEQINKDHTEYGRPNSAASNEPEPGTTHDNTIEKDTTKAKIVNLSLKNEIPKHSIPVHIEKSMKELGTFEKSINNEPEVNDVLPDLDDRKYLDSELDDNEDEYVLTKADHIITKIPTAQSRGTSESKSTSSSISRANKSPLKTFNMLEVFAETNKTTEAKMHRRNYHSNKIRDTEPKEVIPPVVKLDLNHYPHQTRNPLREDGDIARNEVRMQDVVFRFEPGEVFISTKKANQSQTYNRSSERARIIYGKVIHSKDERKDYAKGRYETKDNRSIHTQSTKLDGYRSELGRFESRALDGSITSFSGRDDDGTFNNICITSSRNAPIHEGTEYSADMQTHEKNPTGTINAKGVQVRDISIETDVIGSVKGSSKGKEKPESGKASAKATDTLRSNSGLSDFIVDNNDGESLDSDTEDELHRENISKHSV